MEIAGKSIPRWLKVACATVMPVLVGVVSLSIQGMSPSGNEQRIVLDRLNDPPVAIVGALAHWYDLALIAVMGLTASLLLTSKTLGRISETARRIGESTDHASAFIIGEFLAVLIVSVIIIGMSGLVPAVLFMLVLSLLLGLSLGASINLTPAAARKDVLGFAFKSGNRLVSVLVVSLLCAVMMAPSALAVWMSLLFTGTGPVYAAVASLVVNAAAGIAWLIGLLPGLILVLLRYPFTRKAEPA